MMSLISQNSDRLSPDLGLFNFPFYDGKLLAQHKNCVDYCYERQVCGSYCSDICSNHKCYELQKKFQKQAEKFPQRKSQASQLSCFSWWYTVVICSVCLL